MERWTWMPWIRDRTTGWRKCRTKSIFWFNSRSNQSALSRTTSHDSSHSNNNTNSNSSSSQDINSSLQRATPTQPPTNSTKQPMTSWSSWTTCSSTFSNRTKKVAANLLPPPIHMAASLPAPTTQSFNRSANFVTPLRLHKTPNQLSPQGLCHHHCTRSTRTTRASRATHTSKRTSFRP